MPACRTASRRSSMPIRRAGIARRREGGPVRGAPAPLVLRRRRKPSDRGTERGLGRPGRRGCENRLADTGPGDGERGCQAARRAVSLRQTAIFAKRVPPTCRSPCSRRHLARPVSPEVLVASVGGCRPRYWTRSRRHATSLRLPPSDPRQPRGEFTRTLPAPDARRRSDGRTTNGIPTSGCARPPTQRSRRRIIRGRTCAGGAWARLACCTATIVADLHPDKRRTLRGEGHREVSPPSESIRRLTGGFAGG